MRIDQNIKVAVDAVVFGFQENVLSVLLIKQRFGKLKDKWALPGGFVGSKEGLSAAVKRELKEETGVRLGYMEQLYTFGDKIERDPRFRVISVAYLAIVNPKNMILRPTTDAKEAKWAQVNELPKLAFDHSTIIDVARERLRAKVNYQPIGFNLLEKKFPFSHLEHLYMTILDRKIDRRNFRKKILSFGFVEATDEQRKVGSGRPATLYSFNAKKYRELEASGINFEIKFA